MNDLSELLKAHERLGAVALISFETGVGEMTRRIQGTQESAIVKLRNSEPFRSWQNYIKLYPTRDLSRMEFHTYENSVPLDMSKGLIWSIKVGRMSYTLLITQDTPAQALGDWLFIHEAEGAFGRLNHDLACIALTGNPDSDVSFGDVMRVPDHNMNKLTPDAHAFIRERNLHTFLEVKTTVATIFKDSAIRAMYKYKDSVQSRRIAFPHYTWDLETVTIAPSYVHTSMTLDRYMLNRLSWVHAITALVSFRLRAAGSKDDDLERFKEHMMRELKKVEVISKSWSNHITNVGNENNYLEIDRKLWDFHRDFQTSDAEVLNAINRNHSVLLKKYSTRVIENKKEEDSYLSYMKKWEAFESDGKQLRTDRKKISVMPLLLTENLNAFRKEGTYSLSSIGSFISGKESLYNLWNLATWSRSTHFDTMTEEEKEKMSASEKKYYRRKNMRVDLNDLDVKFQKMLAENGIWGKKNKEEDNVKEKKARSKLPFSPNVPTDDIDSFIFERIEASGDDSDLTKLCMTNAFKLEDPRVSSVLADLMRTDLSAALEIVELIAVEVNNSFNQFTVMGEFVLKKINGFDIYLLIYPTTSTGPIFWSVCFPKIESSYRFSEAFRCPECETTTHHILDFMSADKDKLSQFLNIKSKMIASWVQVVDSFHLDEMNLDHYYDTRVTSHLKMIVSLLMEDKNQTSSCLQNVRYMYMKVSSGHSVQSNPDILFSKFEEFPRSRLLVYCIHRIKKAFDLMYEFRPTPTRVSETGSNEFYNVDDEGVGEKSSDSFDNLISWVDLKEVKTFETALMLSYMGIYHNKDEVDKHRANFKIFTKIIKEELELRNCRKDFSRGEKILASKDTNLPHIKKSEEDKDYGSHEFDFNVVCSMGDLMKKKIMLNNSITEFDWDARMTDMLLDYLYKKRTEDFATFKASSKELKTPLFEGSKIDDKRNRCLENIIKLMMVESVSFCPYSSISELLRLVKERGGDLVTLFMKPQWGGTREILVLDIISRLAKSFIERISRFFCNLMENEMLTKGNRKKEVPKRHIGLVKNKMKEEGIKFTSTNSDSDDASTWCQRFTMPMFSCLLSRIIPDRFSNAIIECLNSSTFKKMVLPNSTLFQFMEKPDVLSFDPELNELKSQFLGRSVNKDLISSPGHRIMSNRSNMGQGILHYTSSLIHSAAMLLHENDCSGLVDRYNKAHEGLNMKILVTTQVSSDDSGVIRTLLFEEPPVLVRPKNILLNMSLRKQAIYPLFGAKHSIEKSSVSNFNGIYEFNSEWAIGNTLLSVKSKMIQASVAAQVNSRMDGRIHSMFNLKRACLENGCTYSITSILSSLQARVHYQTMGARVNPKFSKVNDFMQIVRHPTLGFYPLEPRLFNSSMGLEFANYYNCKKDDIFRRTEEAIYNYKDLEFDEENRPYISLRVAVGNNRRYKNFLKRVTDISGISKFEYKDYFANNPIFYFQRSESSTTSLMKIVRKAHCPGAEDSMMITSASYSYSMGTYLIDHDSMTTKYFSIEDKEYISEKKSLLKAYYEVSKVMLKNFDKESEWEKMAEVLYPFRSNYDKAVSILESLPDAAMVYNSRSSKLNTIYMSEIKHEVPPLAALKWVWFSLDTMHGKSACERVFSKLKSQFTWLRDTFSETYSEPTCPMLHNPYGLLEYVSSWEEKTKTFRFLGKYPVVPTTIDEAIELSIRFMGSNYEQFGPVEVSTDTPLSLMRHIYSKVVLSATAPTLTYDEKIDYIKQIKMDEQLHVELMKHHRQFRERDYKIFTLLSLLNGFSLPRSNLKDKRNQFEAIWISPQMLQDGKWSGRGKLALIIESGLSYLLNITDKTVTSIHCSDESLTLDRNLNIIGAVLKEFTPPSKTASDLYVRLDTKQRGFISEKSYQWGGIPLKVRKLDIDDFLQNSQSDGMCISFDESFVYINHRALSDGLLVAHNPDRPLFYKIRLDSNIMDTKIEDSCNDPTEAYTENLPLAINSFVLKELREDPDCDLYMQILRRNIRMRFSVNYQISEYKNPVTKDILNLEPYVYDPSLEVTDVVLQLMNTPANENDIYSLDQNNADLTLDDIDVDGDAKTFPTGVINSHRMFDNYMQVLQEVRGDLRNLLFSQTTALNFINVLRRRAQEDPGSTHDTLFQLVLAYHNLSENQEEEEISFFSSGNSTNVGNGR